MMWANVQVFYTPNGLEIITNSQKKNRENA
jgi:hypothetical protein